MDNLSGFQRDLLYVIAGLEQPSGQDVKDELEQYVDGEINHGQLYPNLDSLVKKEYVEKGPLDRRTNYYAITEQGQEVLRDRRRWEDQYTAIEA
ncbi:PadR family transcriptional regulator [Haloprofundus halobius]|uniref:PadR family transcriptional regulator n=1 Tax=Haloprofundus halobius TaxID=2876194 RepID=UPI001CCFD6F3|nr:PadR family transcriptional regulator [Haloprofundus halobius]